MVLDGPTAPGLATAAFSTPFRLVRAVESERGDSLMVGPKVLLADAELADWSPLKFQRHYLTELVDGHKDDVMLSYQDGSIALALSAVGEGAAAFANLPLTTDGSNLAGSPMFPAMVQELVHALRRGQNAQGVTPGKTWVLDAPTRGDAPVAVSGPGQREIPVRVIASGRVTRLVLPVAGEPGVYLAKQSGETVAAGVVNPDARESDTRPVVLSSLKVGSRTTTTVVADEEEWLLTGRNRPLWPPLAVGAAAFLALELLFLSLWRERSTGGARAA